MRIGIIADDLTGAADTAARFAQRGFESRVGFRIVEGEESFPPAEGDVLAYDTATRDMEREQAQTIHQIVRQAARKLAEAEPRIVFKKIDSTLRGHLRLELEAARSEFPNLLAVVCPAFPAQGRKVRAGVLHIHDAPWTATEFAQVGLSGNATVRGAFGMEADAGAKELSLSDIRQGVEELEARLQEWQAQGTHTVFCDAESDPDLDILAQVLLRQPQHYLPVGSAGLARAIANALPTGASPPNVGTLMEWIQYGRVLVVVGSLHTASRRQAQVLADKLNITPVAINHMGDRMQNLTQAAREINRQYVYGEMVVTLSTPDTPDADAAQDFAWMPGAVARGVCLYQWASSHGVDALVICGGNTALELCRQFDAAGLQIMGEWEPGIVVSRLILSPHCEHQYIFSGLSLVTKAGGFGDEETLDRLLRLS